VAIPIAVGTVCCRLDSQYRTQVDGLVRTKLIFYNYFLNHHTFLITHSPIASRGFVFRSFANSRVHH